ncbi:MAG: DedA family protein [Candidatus Micrarchaeia archaeon]
MLLESTSLPVPSEIIMPLAGLLSRDGLFLFPLAFLAATLGSLIGVLIDYYIGYILGKDIIYKHMHFFHLKKEEIDKFDKWFNSNMALTVFISRLIPVIRTFMSFPAGFAKMDMKDFISYSLLGIIIWDFILMLFGYYLIASSNINIVIISIILFLLTLYFIYKIAKKHITKPITAH